MEYRIVKRPNIWTDQDHYYPEEKWKWFPFWFRFDGGNGGQVFFNEENDAIGFIEKVKESLIKTEI